MTEVTNVIVYTYKKQRALSKNQFINNNKRINVKQTMINDSIFNVRTIHKKSKYTLNFVLYLFF